MSTATTMADGEEFPFVEFMVRKIRKGWGKVKGFFSSQAVREVTTEDAVVTNRRGFLWLLFQLTKIPHWVGIGLEYLVRGVVAVATTAITLLAVLLTMVIAGGYVVFNALAFVVVMTAALIATILSTPHMAMLDGKDAVEADWLQLKYRFLHPFSGLRSAFRRAKEADVFADTTDEQTVETTAEAPTTIAYSTEEKKSNLTSPKGRATPSRDGRSAHRSVQQRLKDES